MTKEKRNNMQNKIWFWTSLLLVFTITPIAIISIWLGEPRSVLYYRMAFIFYPIVTFFTGLVFGVKYMYKIKTVNLYSKEEIKELEDGVMED